MTTGTGAARLYSDASNTIVDYVHNSCLQHFADRPFRCGQCQHLDIRRLRFGNGLAAPHSKWDRYESDNGLVWQYDSTGRAHSGCCKLGHTSEKTISIRSPFQHSGFSQEEQKPVQLNIPKKETKPEVKPEVKPEIKPEVKPEPQAPVAGQKEADKPDYSTKRTVGFQMQPTRPEPAKTDIPATRQFLYDYNIFSLDLDEKKAMIERIQWKLNFWTSFNYFNNGDLRVLNEQNQTSIEETDNKIYFMVTGVELDAFFPIHPRLDFRVDVWRAGFSGAMTSLAAVTPTTT